ncbi:MAG: hypothetical protein QW795_08205 [Candidatus Bathyarchaeia archaeon]
MGLARAHAAISSCVRNAQSAISFEDITFVETLFNAQRFTRVAVQPVSDWLV